MGRRGRPSAENDLPCMECECAAASTSGRAAWIWEWMAKAAPLSSAPSPSMMAPWESTRIRLDAVMWENGTPHGLTQNVSGSSGSRTVTWPAAPTAPSSKPSLAKIR